VSNEFRPRISADGSPPLASHDAPPGIPIPNRSFARGSVTSSSDVGTATMYSGTYDSVSQTASIAANFWGWVSATCRPYMSPWSTWRGAVMRSATSAIFRVASQNETFWMW